VHLQPVFELRYRQAINARRTFVLDHPLIRQLQVAAFDHLFHELVVLRFRSPGCRRAKLRTQSISARLLACTPRRGHPCGCFCFIASLRDHPSYSRLRCSALRRHRLLWPLLTSATASRNLAIPVASRHGCRSPRVLRTHLHAYARRIYDTAFCTCIGLCILLPAHPTVLPLSASCSSRQRFASGFLPTPGHPRNRCLPLTLAHVGCVGDFHPQMSAPCRAHKRKRPPEGGRFTQRCIPLINSGSCRS
jgi:hypothetical protein